MSRMDAADTKTDTDTETDGRTVTKTDKEADSELKEQTGMENYCMMVHAALACTSVKKGRDF